MLRPLLLRSEKRYQREKEDEVIFPELGKQVSLQYGREWRVTASSLDCFCMYFSYLEQQRDHQLEVALPTTTIHQDLALSQRTSI